jgi:hypothetical protein
MVWAEAPASSEHVTKKFFMVNRAAKAISLNFEAFYKRW